MSRIADTFQRIRSQGDVALAVYLTVGYPDAETCPDLVLAAVKGGADLVELGIPFSDPLADGTTVQRASALALAAGVTMEICLNTALLLRQEGLTVPLILMGYYNPILHYGLERFAQKAGEAGVDGIIVPDLPPEEASPLDDALKEQGLDLIFMLAPTSTEERISKVVNRARGFIYCVSLTGVTGARQSTPSRAVELTQRVRRHTSLPIAVGFGISLPEHVSAIGHDADGVIVGSAFLDTIEGAPPARRSEAVVSFLQGLKAGSHTTG